MAKKKAKHVHRTGRVSREEVARRKELREKIVQEIPPANRRKPPRTGLCADIRRARESKGLTWYAVAKLADISNPSTIRDIEYGRDAKLSNVQAVVKALGLRIELVEGGGVG